MLDTLKYAKRLQEAGFTSLQAEAQAQALWEAIEGTVATKQDIDLLRQELSELETRIDGRFKALEAGLEARFIGVDGRFKALEAGLEARFIGVDGRFKALEAGLEARFIGVDGRFKALEAGLEARFIGVDGRFRLLYWMIGFNLALTVAVLLKLLVS